MITDEGPDLEPPPDPDVEPWLEAPPPLSRAVPLFPVDALPEALGEYVAQLAVATQTPEDMPGMLVLSVIAAAAARRVRLEVRDGWAEPLNLFTTVVLPPAARKSKVYAEVVRPLRQFEREMAERMRPLRAAAQSKLDLADRRLKVALDRAAKSTTDRLEAEAEVELLTAEKIAVIVPPEPRLLADDCTPERLATLLAEHGGRMAILSPEGGVFELMAGRYSDNKTANLDVYLKGHSGDDLRVDRVGRPSDNVDRPALTIGLAIQPDVLRRLRDQPGFRGRGLLGRILYALPRNTVGRRDVHPPSLSPRVAAEYERTVRNLLAIEPTLDASDAPAEHVLRLSPAAHATLLEYMRWLEPQLGPGGELEHVQDWAGKSAGAGCRIAALLHLTGAPGALESQVSGETMQSALRIVRYLLAHALAAFDDMGADLPHRAARAILDLFEHVPMPDGGWTRSQVHRRLRKRAEFYAAESLHDGFTLLADLGWVRLHDDKSTGGRPKGYLELHPRLRGQKGQKAGTEGAFGPFWPQSEPPARETEVAP